MSPLKIELGFTMLEVMIASLVGSIAVLGAFELARTQVQSFGSQEESLKAQAAQRVVFEAIAKDIRNSGYGMGFYAALPPNHTWAVQDNSSATFRGYPAIRIANNLPSTSGQFTAGSDAIMALRVTSAPARLTTQVPCAPGTSASFSVDNFTPLIQCAQAGGFVLISDQTTPSSVPTAVLYQLAIQASPTSASALTFTNTYINPSATTGCSDGGVNPDSLPPKGVGQGAAVVCVQPVTYWVDVNAQLRLWQGGISTQSGDTVIKGSDGVGTVIINPTSDAILADGVEDLQVSVQMSGMASPTALANQWIFTSPSLTLTAEEQLAEARIVRISVLVRSTRMSNDSQGGMNWPALIEDHVTPTCVGTGSTCLPAGFDRYLVSFEAALRNMRIFDALSDTTQTMSLIRSYR